jgi:hypothetical protein
MPQNIAATQQMRITRMKQKLVQSRYEGLAVSAARAILIVWVIAVVLQGASGVVA